MNKKFRAYDNDYSEYLEHFEISMYGDVCDIHGMVLNAVLEQWTGLTDKNGTEIFEGDILRHPNGDIFKIIFVLSYCGFRAVYNDNSKDSSNITLQINENGLAIVIGNIHQNKELLK